jgi:hypothetical protein
MQAQIVSKGVFLSLSGEKKRFALSFHRELCRGKKCDLRDQVRLLFERMCQVAITGSHPGAGQIVVSKLLRG